MVKGPLHGVEHHMRFQEILARVAAERTEPKRIGPFITISRQHGSGGRDIAQLLADRLGWKALDRELVERLADRIEVAPTMLELMDETSTNWFRETILNLLEPRLMEQYAYLRKLGQIMLLAAYEGHVIFLGRGANFLLPERGGIRALVVAQRAARVERLRTREDLDLQQAERRLSERDHNRAEFIRRNFHREVDDPVHYDVTLNTSALDIDGCVDLICHLVKQRDN